MDVHVLLCSPGEFGGAPHEPVLHLSRTKLQANTMEVQELSAGSKISQWEDHPVLVYKDGQADLFCMHSPTHYSLMKVGCVKSALLNIMLPFGSSIKGTNPPPAAVKHTVRHHSLMLSGLI